MSYKVLARKWRPQRFDQIIGQKAVTRTLQNALTSGRLAHAFVFAGPRGVGKTTTARILARSLNCEKGPTAEPCGTCDACVEIAEGRDIDVLEIDAATHTQVDTIREVIIAGLNIVPVRDRYKIFIIDEVHQLSPGSFNALLKSVEEPPPHVVFMMATTQLEKIPDTVLSRAQVHEFRTISTNTIAGQLRKIVDAEKVAVGDESLQLIARDADGSMRDAQSKLDQVIAFTGATIGPDDVSTVLGLVGRDLLLDAIQAVADEEASAAFALAERAVEMGYDLRLVCRELSRVVRDLLVLSVDATRISDPEIAGEGERERLKALAARFSREDLLRAFDLLTKAESDIRNAAQPRYHLEMALLRWIYLRKLVSIEDLIAGSGAAPGGPGRAAKASPGPGAGPSFSSGVAGGRSGGPSAGPGPAVGPSSSSGVAGGRGGGPSAGPGPGVGPGFNSGVAGGRSEGPSATTPAGAPLLKDALLAEIRKSKGVFYNTIVVQAQTIDVSDDRVSFTFSAAQRALRDQFEQNRPWLESLARALSGRKIVVTSVHVDAPPAPAAAAATSARNGEKPPADSRPADKPSADRKIALREQALADEGVQALLDVFSAEISDVEEM